MTEIDRRNFLEKGIAVAAAAGLRTPNAVAAGGLGLAFGNRAHFFAPKTVKEKLIWCFVEILGCAPPASLDAPGLAEPILAFQFPGGGSLSVEFTANALDERDARRGAWLEIRSSDLAALKQKIISAGLPQVEYAATNAFYFAAPGGQVFGVTSGRKVSTED